MLDPVRQEVIALAHAVVVKVGTNVLTADDGRLDPARLQGLADQIHRIRSTGRKVALVSSGAIGAGIGRLGLGKRPTDLRHLQACAAIGQGSLMRAYQECFDRHGTHTAQVLLTAGDFDSRSRYLNVRNTILTLFEWDVLPIINENDTVSVAEIRFGDNDHLAAMVTNLLRAPLLVLLTNVDGLFVGDPRADSAATKLDTVPVIDAQILGMAGASKSALGTGGMHSKLRRPSGDHRRRIGHHGERQPAGHPRHDLRRRAGRHPLPAARHLAAVVEALAWVHGPTQGPPDVGRRSADGRPGNGPQFAADRRGASSGRVQQGRRAFAVRPGRA